MRPHKKISLIAYSFSFVLALLPALGNALDLTIEPRVQAGIMDYEFEQKASTTPGGAIDQGFKLVSSMPLGVNGYNYDFDNKGGEKESYQTDLSERVLRFSGGLSYQF